MLCLGGSDDEGDTLREGLEVSGVQDGETSAQAGYLLGQVRRLELTGDLEGLEGFA